MKRLRISDSIGEKSRAKYTGSLYAQFREYFDILLNSERSGEEEDAFNNEYVSNIEMESQISSFIERRRNAITALLGATGIGKSTILRKMFGLIGQPRFASFDKNTFIIPFYMDSYNLDQIDRNTSLSVQNVITSQIRTSVEMICQNYQIPLIDIELAKFIRTHKKQLLSSLSIDPNASDQDRVEFLRTMRPYAAVAEELKYSAFYSPIRRIVLIVDDIESTTYVQHKEMILGVLKLRECLQSTGHLSRSYKVDIIISCRPATFDRLSQDHEIDGFSHGRPILFSRPVPLISIVRKRFESAIEAIGEGKVASHGEVPADVSDLSAWRQAYEVLENIIDKITERHGDLIVRLCNQDMRKAQREIVEILENSRWFESRPPHEGQIEIFEENYRTSDAGVLRALGLKFHNAHVEHRNAAIANIFRNYQKEIYDLTIVMCLRFFGQISKINALAPINENDLKEALLSCYDEYFILQEFDTIVRYLEWCGLVRIEIVRNETRGTGDKFLIPLQKGFAILNLIKETSVVLEILRDSTFVRVSDRASFRYGRSVGTCILPYSARFVAIADFIQEIGAAEASILQRVSREKERDLFERRFGRIYVAHNALLGFEKSIKRYFYDPDTRRTNTPRSVQTRSKELRSFLKGAGLLKPSSGS